MTTRKLPGQPTNAHSIAVLLPAVAVLIGLPRTARAQDVDIEIPVLIVEETDELVDDTLDLANIVQTAAKGVTTIQEAPAIVTVVTSEEIRERGWTTLQEMTNSVPGWLQLDAIHSQFPFPLTRGTIQSTMYMHNGISMFDPNLNVPTVWRVQPMETIKRVEMITGPGGVLWGANSFLGIMNVITKDAEDVPGGVEAAVTTGTGNGDRDMLRGYVMAGITELFSEDSKLFIHSSFETYVGPGFEMPLHMFSQPLPQPNSNLLYGPLARAEPPRSFLFNFDGKLTIGALNLYFNAPIVERHTPLGFPGFVVRKDSPEDTLRDPMTGELLCPKEDPLFDPGDQCLDKGRLSRDNEPDFFDRYLIAEYETRLAEGKAGVALKGYFVQFVRNFKQLGVLAPVPGLLEGGLAFKTDPTSYRAGGIFDGDIDLPGNARLLYGAEAFHEWFPANDKQTRQGAGIESTFIGPYQLERLPVPCPRRLQRDENGNSLGASEFIPGCPLTFEFTASRTVLGAYINPQWKSKDNKLILDAGSRVQVAPSALGKVDYDPQTVFSGAAVYELADNWHTKLNFAQGFRPPVFNNTNSNGDSIEIDGARDLKVETSASGQGEINARLFKGERRIREFNFRADYSYTKLQNLIQLVQGRYENVGDRGIHSAEFLGKLYIRGGHRLELGYTWLRINTSDKGRFRSMPEHWFTLSGIFKLSDSLLTTTSLHVRGAMEDANRIIEHRNYTFDEQGRVINATTGMRENLLVQPHEMVLDRLPPAGDLTLGLAYTGITNLRLGAFAYNAFNNRYYQPDAFFDYEPRLEFLANPIPDFRFQVNATYNY